MRDSNIAWCHNTFNPWRGCSGERCALARLGLCYADRMETARGRTFSEVISTSPKYWRQPWQWEREATALNKAVRVFCGSLMDFNDRQAEDWRHQFWPIAKLTPHLVWMVLTKIPERFSETLPEDWNDGYPNVWLGTSVLNAEDFRRNTKALRGVNAARRFLSMEPLFGAVPKPDFTGIDQILVGGLSGPKWRDHVMDMRWAIDLYHAAKQQGVAYFFKQVSARKDEQGIDEIGRALDGKPRTIREVPDYKYQWSEIRVKGDARQPVSPTREQREKQ
jgi:protein gp37